MMTLLLWDGLKLSIEIQLREILNFILTFVQNVTTLHHNN